MEGSVGKSSTKVLMLICSVHLQGRGSQAGRGRHVDRGAYVHNKGQLASLARRRPSECHQRQGDTAPDRSCGNWRRLGILRTTARKKWSGVANNIRRFNRQDIQDDEGWEAVYDIGNTRKFSSDLQTATDAALAEEHSTIYVNRAGPPTKQDGPDWW
jgi:hypothetical protein